MVFSESSGFSIAPLPTTSPAVKMTMRTCTLCGSNCHGSGACSESAGGFMLFGVRLTENSIVGGGSPPFRKSASMTNLAHYDRHRQDSNADLAAGYASDDAGKCRERRRGVPWTEDEHRLFLLGLKAVGKGDWRGISRNFVKTRTPTQVASHAQKYFLRRSGVNRRRRRSSLFDITADTLMNPSSSEEHLQSKPPLNLRANRADTLMNPSSSEEHLQSKPPLNQRARAPPSLQMNLPSSRMADLNLNEFPPPLPAAPEPSGETAARFCGNRESAISVA